MHTAHFLTGLDTVMLMAPSFGFLAFWIFGLDEQIAAPREHPHRRSFCRPHWTGEAQISDPDGTPWRPRPAKIRRPQD